MALTSCPRCGKIFEKIRFPVCPRCQDDEEKDYDKVRQALDECPEMNADQVSELTQVDIAAISRMLKEGLISNATMLSGEIKCGMCGAPAISASKKLCQACLEKLNARVTQAQSKILLEERKAPQVDKFLGGAHNAFGKKRRS